MLSTRLVSWATPFLLLALLSGCGSSGLSPEERARVGMVKIVPPDKEPKAAIYSDATSKAAGAAAAPFGIVGGLIGGAVAAVSIEKGRKRFASVTEPRARETSQILADKLIERLRLTGKLPVATAGKHQGTLQFKSINYGVAHAGDQRFNAIVSTEIVVSDPQGDSVWRRYLSGSSEETFTLDAAKSNPAVFRSALEQAAGAIANQATEQL